MQRSTNRILVTHAGSLPRPEDVRAMVIARSSGQPYDQGALTRGLHRAVAAVAQQQVASGIDIVNDGEFSKTNFTNYVRERISGIEHRSLAPGEGPPPQLIYGRDLLEFPEYFDRGPSFGAGNAGSAAQMRAFCVGPITYSGHTAIQEDIEHFKAALQGVPVEDAFLPANSPGTIEHWLRNEYYPNDEAFLYAIADAMHEEYKAIVDAGFILQIDDPDLADAWQIHPEMDVAAYRKFADLRIEALNHALRDLPVEQLRFHMCWGSYKGPHKYDIPLRDIVDLILKVRAQAYSIEASNPCHEHEWRVWEEVKLPEGKILIPGVVGHYSDFIEHPELVAERLVRYAKLVGRENVIAGTDCGLGTRVGHPKICWAKFQTMAEGAQLATKQLWG
ncbi:MAG: cobalamin-independent methionine synthase II family protein [Chloroflexi bacterium]|nr:cobalamin-independent methionine synthase II family protein [Chloroflexota bacterium]